MTLTFPRWVAMLVIGCGVLVAAFFSPKNIEPMWRWRGFNESASSVTLREIAQARVQHASSLLAARSLWLDVQAAERALRALPAGAEAPVVFIGNYSAASKANLEQIVRTERAALPAHGVAPIGIVVVPAEDLAFVSVASAPTNPTGSDALWFNRSIKNGNTRRMIMPRTETGGRCVIVLRLNAVAASQPGHLPPRSLLGGCAFYDAFGAPGRAVTDQFTTSSLYRMQSYNATVPDSVWHFVMHLDFETDRSLMHSARCAAGDDAACLGILRVDAQQNGYDFAQRGVNATRPAGISSAMGVVAGGATETKLLGTLARDLGPARFAQLWTSDRPFADAYFDVSGQSLGSWLRLQLVRGDGPYRAGPWNPPVSTALTLLFVICCAGVAVRFAPRPRVN